MANGKESFIGKLVKEEAERRDLSYDKSNTLLTQHNSSSKRIISTGIYERGQTQLAEKERIIVLRLQEKELEEVSELREPCLNNTMQIEGTFQDRLITTSEKTKIHKALIVQKELNRTNFQPKLTSASWKV